MDDTLQSARSVSIWRPPADWPADRDSAVDLRLKILGKKRSTVLTGIAFYLLFALLLTWLAHGVDVLAGVFVLLCVWMLANLILFEAGTGRWLPAGKALLSEVPTRRVSAEVVTYKRNTAVLSIESNSLQVRGANWAVRQIIARAGEVWLVGPDADGAAVVFVDAMPVPLPAKVVAATERTEPEPLADQGALTAWYAARHVRIQWVPIVLNAVMFSAVIYDLSRPLMKSGGTGTFAGLYVCFAIVLFVLGLIRAGIQLRLPSLLKAGSWQSYPATVGKWKAVARPFGDLELTLALPDGTALPVTVKHASNELVANISATGTLWVAGKAERRKPVAVGVPGYPIAAPAVFRPTA